MLTARELHARGVAQMQAGRVAAAREPLRRALDRTDDEAFLGSVEASLAYVEAELGDRDEAMRLCQRALARPGLDEVTRGTIHGQRALLLMLGGRTAEALDEFATAIGLLQGSPVVLGRAHVNRGNVRLQLGDLGRARDDFTVGAGHLAGAGLPVEAAMAEHNLGYTHFLAGDLPDALRLMDTARPVLAPLSPVSAATCDQDRAEVLLAAGLVREGREALDGAARAYGARRLRRRQAEAELALARATLHVDPAGARRSARSAARHFARAGAEAMRRRAEVAALVAEAELGTASPRRLRAESERLAEEMEKQGLDWPAAGARLVAARAGGGPVGPRVAADAPLEIRLLDHGVRADVATVAGRTDVALDELRSGLSDLHAWQSSFGSLDLQTGVTGQGVRLAASGLALAVGSRDPEVLFEWSERARMLASRVQPVRAPEDPQIVADLTELRGMATGDGMRDAAREAELRQRVRERAWQHRGSGAVADPLTLPELRSALDDGTALTAYVVAAGHVVALVVTAEDVTWVDLGERSRVDALLGGLLPDLDVAASDLAEPMAGFVRAELADRLASIADVLVTPVLAAVGDRAVVLTPSGVLAGVPWTLLPGFTGRPVTVAQSATSWRARRTTPLRSATAGFVAGPRVARAEDEVTAAAKEWPAARVLTGGDATAAAVSELAGSVDVLHVAAHGRHSAENAMFSGLQLADGPWFGYDVDQLRQVPDVVLLSACEVGRSTVRWGDELIGMTTAWLHAGARCVIASPAAVNDRAAYDVLVAVHQQLAAGVGPAAALAAAVPAVSAGTAPVPLVCFG
ncbi:CHAT domain-containing protein [Nocardioides sp.]|uniref:CHAT domain-containing protein n=1 Tax=Nocardioides sp. TaxID=35761 RepID=UPI003784D8B1